MGGWVKPDGAENYHYDIDHVTQEQYTDAITDELIDYMLALRKIVSYGPGEQQRIAANILAEHGKEES